MDKATHSKFCGPIQCMKCYVRIWEFDTKGAWFRSCDQFWNFGSPLYLRNGCSYKLCIWYIMY